MRPLWPILDTPARALFQQAAFACANERFAECLELLRAAHAAALSDLGSSHVTTIHIAGYLADQLRHQGCSEEAVSLAHHTLRTAEQSPIKEPGSLLHLLLVLYQTAGPGNPDEIDRLSQRYAAIQEACHHRVLKLPPLPEPTTEVERLVFEAILFDEAGNQPEIVEREALIQRAYQLGLETLGEDHPHTRRALSELAAIDLAQGRLRLTEERRHRALDLAMRTEGPESKAVEAACAALAHLYSLLGEYQGAEAYYRRVIAIKERREEPGPNTYHMARCLALQNRVEEARELFRKTVADGCNWLPDAWLRTTRFYHWWHLGYLGQGSAEHVASTIQHLEQAIARATGAGRLQSAVEHLDDLTALLRGLGKLEAVSEVIERASMLRQRLIASDI